MESNNTDDFIDYQEPQIDDSFNALVRQIFTYSLYAENEYLNLNNNINYNSSFFDNPYSNIIDTEIQGEEIQGEEIQREEDQGQEDYSRINFFNFFNPFLPMMDIFDPIDSVLQESFEINQQNSGLEKTDHIIKISSQRYSSLSDSIRDENKACSICIVDFEIDDMISITNCNHIYHTDCIKEWGKYKNECPVCREALE